MQLLELYKKLTDTRDFWFNQDTYDIITLKCPEILKLKINKLLSDEEKEIVVEIEEYV